MQELGCSNLASCNRATEQLFGFKDQGTTCESFQLATSRLESLVVRVVLGWKLVAGLDIDVDTWLKHLETKNKLLA